MKYAVIVCLLFCFVVSCKSNNVQDDHSILDDDLRSSYLELNESIYKAKSALLFDNEITVNDCDSYLKLSKDNKMLETIENQLIKSEYLICDALSAISQFTLYTGEVQQKLIGEKLLHNLDLRTFPNSFSRLANESSFTLGKIFPDNSSASGNIAFFESDDWAFTLKVVAVIDANKNVYQDWVVQLADESKLGNYRNYATFIIYDIQNDNYLKAVVYP
jgi:hypothetical protein